MKKDLTDAINEYLLIYKSKVSPETLAEFTNMDRNDLVLCHFGLGLYIRNNYLLPKSKIYELFEAEGILTKDDMSSIIIRMWHNILRKESGIQPDINDDYEWPGIAQQVIIVERVENEIAVCEINSVLVNIPLSKIDGTVHRGDILYADVTGTQYKVNSF